MSTRRLNPPTPAPKAVKFFSGSRKTSKPTVPATPYSSESFPSVMDVANPLNSTAPLVTPTVTETETLTFMSWVKDTPKLLTFTVGFTRLTGPNRITVGRLGAASSNS